MYEVEEAKELVRSVVCPNCWSKFSPDRVKFISQHPDLIGDEVAGEDEFYRFEPVRFTVNGEALDAKGVACSEMACPKCHLSICRPLLENASLFISLIGAPAAGKSYYLTSMIWQLRHIMPKFGVTFTDADPVSNGVIHDYEHKLFMESDSDKFVEIPKTQTDDPKLYCNIFDGGVMVRCPKPLQFKMQYQSNVKKQSDGKVLVMYDNAGEDYLPQGATMSSRAIMHLAKSNILYMLFDPTQDVRFKALCQQQKFSTGVSRQETILRNTIVQIRRYLRLSDMQKIKTPLVILVSKFDMFNDRLGIDIDKEPLLDKDGGICVDTNRVEQYSEILRKLFLEYCPEIVNSAEDISSTVRFIPVSSLGHPPVLTKEGSRDYYGIKSGEISSKWVYAPILYALAKWSHGMVTGV